MGTCGVGGGSGVLGTGLIINMVLYLLSVVHRKDPLKPLSTRHPPARGSADERRFHRRIVRRREPPMRRWAQTFLLLLHKRVGRKKRAMDGILRSPQSHSPTTHRL